MHADERRHRPQRVHRPWARHVLLLGDCSSDILSPLFDHAPALCFWEYKNGASAPLNSVLGRLSTFRCSKRHDVRKKRCFQQVSTPTGQARVVAFARTRIQRRQPRDPGNLPQQLAIEPKLEAFPTVARAPIASCALLWSPASHRHKFPGSAPCAHHATPCIYPRGALSPKACSVLRVSPWLAFLVVTTGQFCMAFFVSY